MIRYLLDTNIVIYVIKRRPAEVLQTFNQHTGRIPSLALITIMIITTQPLKRLA